MNENDLKLLILLNNEKSLSKTAKKLFISQPALSYRLKKIEEEVGEILFFRSKNGLHLTPQGEYLLNFVEDIQEQIQKMKEEIKHVSSKNIYGKIHIGSSNIFSNYELPEIIKEFNKIYPDIRISITSSRSSEIFTMFNNQEVTVAFLRGNYKWSEGYEELITEPVCLASQIELDYEKLPTYPRIKYNTDPILYHQIEQWWNERFSTPPNVIIETNDIKVCFNLIKSGTGYSILPNMGLKDFKHVIRPLFWLDKNPFQRTTALYYRAQSLSLPYVKVFVEFVKKYYKK